MQNKKPYVIGVTGGSGSGKTTFLRELRHRFGKDKLCVLSQDNYYRERTAQHIDEEGVRNFDRLDSIDIQSFERDIAKLVSGESVERLEYVFNNAERTPETLIFKSAPVIMVEGLFVYASDLIRDMLDLKVYIYVNDAKKVMRRIKRDRIERNYPLEDVLYRYENHVLPSYKKYIQPVMSQADIIVNNNFNMDAAIDLFTCFIEQRTM